MTRKKPASAKQKKAELQLKRAIKRGDAPAPERPVQSKSRRRGQGSRFGAGKSGPLSSSGVSSRRLQSSFLKLSPEFLATAKQLASTLPLERPIPLSAALLPDELLDIAGSGKLTCPKRPKWRYDMEKKEVERNEEAIFAKWLEQTDALVEKWRAAGPGADETGESKSANEGNSTDPNTEFPRSPTYYERNLEVWRQFWRVTEISQILLILLDCRVPPLHYPPSLHDYISSLRPTRKVVLVLTKVDVVGDACATSWTDFLTKRYPGVKVVRVESYRERQGTEERKGQGKRTHYDPYIPTPFLTSLVSALRDAHEELLQPPPHVRDDPAKLAAWTPRIRESVDWEAIGRPLVDEAPKSDDNQVTSLEGDTEVEDLKYLTVGLIGQPNVGKSSLLNALFGTHKVKASRTPGKTKHFQTLFWTPQIRLVDCPGLVMPNLVGMEMQTLSGVLPISQIPSIPSCIHLAGTLLPLERAFSLEHPSTMEEAAEDKRTWRGERPQAKVEDLQWTAMDILTAFAHSKGWLTAKAGRPDVNRAGNAILRSLAEAKVRWAFWPPGSDTSALGRNDMGLWLGSHAGQIDDEDEDESDEEEIAELSEEETSSENVEEDSEESGLNVEVNRGRFGALALDDA